MRTRHRPSRRRRAARRSRGSTRSRRPIDLPGSGARHQIVGQVCTGAFDCWSDR
jgi:hypothetical protein